MSERGNEDSGREDSARDFESDEEQMQANDEPPEYIIPILIEAGLAVGPNTPEFISPALINENDEYEKALIAILKAWKGAVDKPTAQVYLRLFISSMTEGGTYEEFVPQLQQIYSSYDLKKIPKCGAVIPKEAEFCYRCFDCQKSDQAIFCKACFAKSNHRGHR